MCHILYIRQNNKSIIAYYCYKKCGGRTFPLCSYIPPCFMFQACTGAYEIQNILGNHKRAVELISASGTTYSSSLLGVDQQPQTPLPSKQHHDPPEYLTSSTRQAPQRNGTGSSSQLPRYSLRLLTFSKDIQF